MAKYICYAEDAEDLTERVSEAVVRAQQRGDWSFAMEDDDREPVEIEVTCSKGHRNVFQV